MSGIQQGLLASYAEAVVPGLPEGTLLFFDRPSAGTGIPSGWSIFTDYLGENLENFAIRGATTFSKNAATPAPISLEPGVYTTGPAGSHPAPTLFTGPTSGNVGAQPIGGQLAAGAHTHSVTVTGAPTTFPNPGGEINAGEQQGVRVPLIRANSNVLKIPINAIVFSGTSTVFTNFSRKLWPAFFPATPQPAAAGMYTVSAATGGTSANTTIPFPAEISQLLSSAPQFSIAPSGNHQHSASAPGPGGPNASPTTPNMTRHLAAGIHSHSVSAPTVLTPNAFGVGVWKQFKHLLPLTAATEQDVVSGMIVMYSGTSVPPGWLLCDGTNGTPNMVDFFIGYNNTISTSNNVVGNNAIGGSIPGTAGPTLGPGWPTTPAPVGGPVQQIPIGWNVVTATNPHGHALTIGRATSVASMGHPAKNDPHSHSGSSAPLGLRATIPADYLPKHLAVIFMQKA